MADQSQALAILNAKGAPNNAANINAIMEALARDPGIADFILKGMTNNEDSKFVDTKLNSMLDLNKPQTAASAIDRNTPAPTSTPAQPTTGPVAARKILPIDNTAAGSAVTGAGGNMKPPGEPGRISAVDNTASGGITAMTGAAGPRGPRISGYETPPDVSATQPNGDTPWWMPLVALAVGGGGAAALANRNRSNPGDSVNGAGIRDGQFIGADVPTARAPLDAQFAGRMAPPQSMDDIIRGSLQRQAGGALPAPTPSLPDNAAAGLTAPPRALPNPGDIPTYPSGAPEIPPQPRPGSDAAKRVQRGYARPR